MFRGGGGGPPRNEYGNDTNEQVSRIQKGPRGSLPSGSSQHLPHASSSSDYLEIYQRESKPPSTFFDPRNDFRLNEFDRNRRYQPLPGYPNFQHYSLHPQLDYRPPPPSHEFNGGNGGQNQGFRHCFPPDRRGGDLLRRNFHDEYGQDIYLRGSGEVRDQHFYDDRRLNQSLASQPPPGSNHIRNTNQSMESTRHSSVYSSLGQSFSSFSSLNHSITPAQGRQQHQWLPMPSKSELGLFGGGGGYVTPRLTGKRNIKTEPNETIDLCKSDDESPPSSKKRVTSLPLKSQDSSVMIPAQSATTATESSSLQVRHDATAEIGSVSAPTSTAAPPMKSSIKNRVSQSSSDFVRWRNRHSKINIDISESDEPPPLSGKEIRATNDDDDDEADDDEEDKDVPRYSPDNSVDFGNSGSYDMPDDESITHALSERKSLQDVTNTSCGRASKVQKYATAEVVSVPAPSATSATSTAAPSYPMTRELILYDISGNEIPGAAGKLRVKIDKPSHHPDARVPEPVKVSVILALTNGGLNVEALEIASAYLSWIDRELSDVLKQRLSKRVKITDYPSIVGLENPKELAFYLCSKLSDIQSSDMFLTALLDLDHLIAIEEPFLSENNGMNGRRAKDNYTNLFPLYQQLNRYVKGCHSVTGNTMLPINGLGLVMNEEEYESNGSTRGQQFSHWLQQPSSGNDSFQSKMNWRVYERKKAIYERVMGDMNSAEFIQCSCDCVKRLMSTTNFSFDGLQAIIEKHGQEVLDIVKRYTDEDVPSLDSLLEERRQLHAMVTATTDVPATASATAASITSTATAASNTRTATANVSTTATAAAKSTAATVSTGTSGLNDIRRLVKRIKKSSNNLIFGKGDIWSRLIQAQVSFNNGTSSIPEYEQFLRLAAEILVVRTQYNENARKSVIRQANAEYVDLNLMEHSLTKNMDSLDRKGDDLQDTGAEGEIDDAAIVQAYQECKNKNANLSGKWEDLVKLSRDMRSLVQSMMYQVTAMRVTRMCPIKTLMDLVKIRGSGDTDVGRAAIRAREFLDRELPGWDGETYPYTVADALGHAMMYLRDGTSVEEKQAACNLVMLISKLLSHEKLRPYFGAAEAESMNKDIRQFEYTKKDDLPAVASGETSHFVGEDKDRKREIRRKKCVRCHLSPIVLKFRCEITPEMAFGACCITTDFVCKSLYTCLHKDNIQITPYVLKSLVTKGANCSKVFKKDFILLDLTQDLEEGTAQSIDRLKKFFGLRSV